MGDDAKGVGVYLADLFHRMTRDLILAGKVADLLDHCHRFLADQHRERLLARRTRLVKHLRTREFRRLSLRLQVNCKREFRLAAGILDLSRLFRHATHMAAASVERLRRKEDGLGPAEPAAVGS